MTRSRSRSRDTSRRGNGHERSSKRHSERDVGRYESISPRRHRSRSPRRYRDRSPRRHNDRHNDSPRRMEGRSHRRESDRGRQFSPSPKRRRVSDGYEQRSLPSLEIGTIFRGTVQSVKAFGCFVELEGQRRHVLVHQSQVSSELEFGREDEDADKIAALEYFCPAGSTVWVKIVDIRHGDQGEKINGSMKVVDQETGEDLDPTGAQARPSRGFGRQENASDDPPAVGSVHKARVASIRPFGAFVQLEGYRANGLVHVSQISDHLGFTREDSDEEKVAALSEIIKVDEMLYVKVTEVKDSDPDSGRGPKIGCSIKLVSQKDGTDLDPNNLKFRPRQADVAGFGGRAPVGANVGQIQQGTIDWGHLNADKVNMDPKNNDYELVGYDEEAGPAENGSHLPPPPKKGLKKQRKLQNPEVTTVEEALAIVERHRRKEAKKKDKKKEKKKHKKKSKKSKHSHKAASNDSSNSESSA